MPKDFLQNLSNSELLELIYGLWQNWFQNEDLTVVCNEYLELNFDLLKQSFETYSQLSLEDLVSLQKILIEKSHYPKDSKLNLFFGASTIPITPFPEILYSLLLKTPIICRIPENYPIVFYDYFQSLIPSSLQDCIKFIHWSREDENMTQLMIDKADCIIVHGSDETVSQIKLVSNKKTILGFGHKASFIICTLDKKVIPQIIQDIKSFKQQGCLSPQVLYILNEKIEYGELDGFAFELANMIDSSDLHLSPEEAYQKQTFIEDICLSNDYRVYGNSVVFSSDKEFEYSIGNGLIWLKTVEKLEDLPRLLGRLRGRIGSVGQNLDNEDQDILKQILPNTRICKIGDMQNPSLFWLQEPTYIN